MGITKPDAYTVGSVDDVEFELLVESEHGIYRNSGLEYNRERNQIRVDNYLSFHEAPINFYDKGGLTMEEFLVKLAEACKGVIDARVCVCDYGITVLGGRVPTPEEELMIAKHYELQQKLIKQVEAIEAEEEFAAYLELEKKYGGVGYVGDCKEYE